MNKTGLVVCNVLSEQANSLLCRGLLVVWDQQLQAGSDAYATQKPT
jgi:hypothetical protein